MSIVKWIVTAAFITGLAGCGGDDRKRTPYVIPPTPLSMPANVSAEGAAGAVTVSWDAVAGADHYNVYYSSDATQDISIYATFPDSGLEQPTTTSVVLDLTGIEVPMYFRVTAEAGEGTESQPGLAAAILSFQPNATNPELIDDHITGLQWNRCNVGQTWSVATSTCTGTATVISDTSAKATYGSTPPATGPRPPTATEVISMRQCHMATTLGALDHNPFLAVCKEWVMGLLQGQDGVYPAFFIYDDDDLSPPTAVCAMHYGSLVIGCANPGISDVRINLVQPAP